MLLNGLHKISGRHRSSASATLPGGVVYHSKRRNLKRIPLAASAVFLVTVLVLFLFAFDFDGSSEFLHAQRKPPPQMSKGEAVDPSLQDAEERRRQLEAWKHSFLIPLNTTMSKPTRTAEYVLPISTTFTTTTTAIPTTLQVPPPPTDAPQNEKPVHFTPQPGALTSLTAATTTTSIAEAAVTEKQLRTLSTRRSEAAPGTEVKNGDSPKEERDLEGKVDTKALPSTTEQAAPTTPVGEATDSPTTANAEQMTDKPPTQRAKTGYQNESGEYQPEEPERVPGLTVTRHTYTPAELLEKFRGVDYIYSFVNGSEVNHHFRKEVRKDCLTAVLQAENEFYMAGGPEAMPHGFAVSRCMPTFLSQNGSSTTLGDFTGTMHHLASTGADNRDRETDELRHSIRSLEQHVRWHRGRVVIVSPGHHPTWVDGAKNFLAGACGDASVQALRLRGTHLRLTTVHQDAVMPYGLRFTADSHVIEQHIWRVRNITPVHVYMNDDYFVNRDVAITDLFNEYGGTIVRTGAGILRNGEFPDAGASWKAGVLHTQQFNIMELDVKREDELPESLIQMWSALRRVNTPTGAAGALPTIAVPSLDETVDVAHHFPPEPLPYRSLAPRRRRRYASHAPFVYCTNMFRFFETRYEREFSLTALKHRSRKAADLFIPFLYNAFVMARPWQASPQFLPYLLQLHRSRNATPTEAPPSVEISLDNFDGCAPATVLAGTVAGQCVFAKFLDNLTFNENVIARVANEEPLYFNINAGFSSDAAASQLREFLHDKFPTPIYLEQSSPSTTVDPEVAGAGGDGENAATTTAANAVADAVLTPTFDALMALPVVGVVSYEEGACPLVRSLWLAFAGHHRGRVHVAVQRHSLGEAGEADEPLREMRRRLGHRVFSAIPVPKCAFGSLVSVGPANRTEALADIALRALRESGGAGVELPSTCGHSGDNDGAAAAGAGLRVRGFVIDARTPSAPVKSVGALRDALAMPGQTLALEDFRAVRVGPEDRDVVLVLAREDADAKAVHWITGASENDLLVTYPLPVEAYENMTAPLVWALP